MPRDGRIHRLAQPAVSTTIGTMDRAPKSNSAQRARLRETFTTVVMPLLPDLRAFAISLTRNVHDAEDLVADTYEKAYRAFGRFRQGTNAKAWMFTILRRLHIDRYRRSLHRPRARPQDELGDRASESARVGTPHGAPSETLAQSIQYNAVLRAIESIPMPFRICVQLRDLHALSYREVGEILDIPPGTVMSRLHRGREYIRRALVREMGDEAGKKPTPQPKPGILD